MYILNVNELFWGIHSSSMDSTIRKLSIVESIMHAKRLASIVLVTNIHLHKKSNHFQTLF